MGRATLAAAAAAALLEVVKDPGWKGKVEGLLPPP